MAQTVTFTNTLIPVSLLSHVTHVWTSVTTSAIKTYLLLFRDELSTALHLPPGTLYWTLWLLLTHWHLLNLG